MPHIRYISVEATIAAVIGAVVSLGFTFAVFGGGVLVPVDGFGLIADTVPQTFFLTFMSALVPTLLTRRRVRAGALAPIRTALRWPLPRSAPLRALLFATVVTAVALAVATLLLSTGPRHYPFWPVAAVKTAYGALMAAVVAANAARAALADPR